MTEGTALQVTGSPHTPTHPSAKPPGRLHHRRQPAPRLTRQGGGEGRGKEGKGGEERAAEGPLAARSAARSRWRGRAEAGHGAAGGGTGSEERSLPELFVLGPSIPSLVLSEGDELRPAGGGGADARLPPGGSGVAAPPCRLPAMAFTFAAFCYMLSLVLCAALIFFAIWHVSTLRGPPAAAPAPGGPSGSLTGGAGAGAGGCGVGRAPETAVGLCTRISASR